jgi:Tol biopolymer transport system component
MRVTTVALAGLLAPVAIPHGGGLLTVPQADSWRFATSPASASVSGDGRYIAFSSYARLVPADNDEQADIYLVDRLSGSVTLESVSADDRPLTGDSSFPRLCADGRYLVFQSVVMGGANGRQDTAIVIRDRLQNTSASVSRHSRPGPIDGRNPAISADGHTVVFASTATDVVDGIDLNGSSEDVYAFDTITKRLLRVSVDSRRMQMPRGASFSPAISGDGRYVAFTSTADLDVAGRPPSAGVVGSPAAQVYVRDTEAGITTRVSVPTNSTGPSGPSDHPAISRDGRYVAFVSEATTFVRRDRNRSADVFIRDLRNLSITLVSRRAGGGTANGASGSPAISADGRFVAFQSDASDLVCARRCAASADDVNLLPDVFLFDRITDRMQWISATEAGGWAEESGGAQVDETGAVVTFSSRHPIDERDIRNDFDLFVRVPERSPMADTHPVDHTSSPGRSE